MELDRELAALAQEWQIRVTTARESCRSPPAHVGPEAVASCAALRATLRGRYHGVCADAQEFSDRVVRASSLVENLNSRLRSYFFLRRQLGKDDLTLGSASRTTAGTCAVKIPVESARVLRSC